MPRGALIVLNTLLLLALAEGGARLAEWIHPQRADVAFEYAPYRMLKMSKAPWPLNREGFRARELETYHGGFLIEFLGGSACLGVGTDPGPTVPERLEQALHRAGLVRAEVLNLCQGGATSAQELAIFIQYGLPLAPQVVLSFDGANDLLHPRPIGEDAGANLPYDNAGLEARVNGQDILSHLALARVASRIALRWWGQRAGGEAIPESAILNSYFYTLSVVRTLSESRKASYAVLFQPVLHYEKPWSAEEAAAWRGIHPRGGDKISHAIRERYTLARGAIAQWAAHTGTPLYDLTDVFASTADTIYSDSVHFRGPRGYALVFDDLARRGLIERIATQYRDWERTEESSQEGRVWPQ